MKRLCALCILALLALHPGSRALGQDDQYVRIYGLIQEADSLHGRSQGSQALAKYMEAQTALRSFQKGYPDWNATVVKFRLSYIDGKIAALSAQAPAAEAEATAAKPGAASGAAPAAKPSTPGDWEAQLANLNTQVRQLQSDKSLLEAKLKEALAALPAATDPRELEKLEDKVKALRKENELLSASLEQERKKIAVVDANALAQARQALADVTRQLAEQKDLVARQSREKDALEARLKTPGAEESTAMTALRAENSFLKKQLADLKAAGPAAAKPDEVSPELARTRAQLAAMQSDLELAKQEKKALEDRLKQAGAGTAAKPATATAAKEEAGRIKQLERERDDLAKKLEAANRSLAKRKGKKGAASADELQNQVSMLRARLEVFEARQVPYSAEEQALFKTPEPKLVAASNPASGRKPVKELSAGSASLVAEAQRHFSARQFTQAEEKYLEVVKKEDKNPSALTDLAVVQIQLNRLDEAEKHVNQALSVTPDNAYALSILGDLKYRQGKYDEAFDALSRSARLDPQSAETQVLLGVTLNQKGMRGPAETALRKALQIQPGNGDAHYNLAVVYAAQQPPMVELARWHYQKALAAGKSKNPDLEQLFEKKAAEAK
jgi:Flp pilus assembly protein TadD